MVDFDCMTPGHLQTPYVKSKYSTNVVVSTKLGKQSYLVIWGFTLTFNCVHQRSEIILEQCNFFHPLFLHTLGVVHSHMS
jgi:hypothetical protein